MGVGHTVGLERGTQWGWGTWVGCGTQWGWGTRVGGVGHTVGCRVLCPVGQGRSQLGPWRPTAHTPTPGYSTLLLSAPWLPSISLVTLGNAPSLPGGPPQPLSRGQGLAWAKNPEEPLGNSPLPGSPQGLPEVALAPERDDGGAAGPADML